MSKKKKRGGADAAEYARDAFLNIPPASANDRTGMVPASPESAEEAGNYSSLMSVPTGEADRRRKDKKR